MGKRIEDIVLDGGPDKFAEGDQLTICEGEPTTYEQANSDKGTGAGKVLARATLAGGDFTQGAGTPSGRQIKVAAKTSMPITQNGNGDHVAICKTADTAFFGATTAPSQAMSSGGTAQTAAFKWTIPDPT